MKYPLSQFEWQSGIEKKFVSTLSTITFEKGLMFAFRTYLGFWIELLQKTLKRNQNRCAAFKISQTFINKMSLKKMLSNMMIVSLELDFYYHRQSLFLETIPA